MKILSLSIPHADGQYGEVLSYIFVLTIPLILEFYVNLSNVFGLGVNLFIQKVDIRGYYPNIHMFFAKFFTYIFFAMLLHISLYKFLSFVPYRHGHKGHGASLLAVREQF